MSGSDTNKQFSSLIDLFESLDIVEKGIEQVYDYLLRNKVVDDVKILVDELDLNLKRIYKVLSVLKDLDLIQIYNRPMNVQVLDPQIALEKLINNKINEIHRQANAKIGECHRALDEVRSAYKIADVSQQPVEFISFIGELDLETLFHALICSRECDIAHGIWYKRDVNIADIINRIDETKEALMKDLEKAKTKTYRVIVSKEYLEHANNRVKDYKPFLSQLKVFSVTDLDIKLRILDEPFSNFIVKDQRELSQPSFDPNDNLIGYFVSSPQEIVDVFINKFNNMFQDAIPIEEEIDDLDEDKLLLLKLLCTI